ncbi:MAG: HDOD domain-containing protein [Phycisphaerae bacterium]
MKTTAINLVERVEHLPVLPSTTVRLICLLNDKSTTIEQIVEVIQYDQNLTVQVLKLCNTAYFGLVRRISSLREALVYLGAKNIMQIVMGIHCGTLFQQPREGYGLMAGMLWRHSTAVALIAERLAKNYLKDGPQAGMFFTAGLLHDIGKVVMDQVLDESYAQILELLSARPMRFYEAEREIVGFCHMEVGEMITTRWQLPETIVAVTRHHHEPENYSGANELVRQAVELVHIADALALSLGMGVGNDGLMYSHSSRIVERYGMTAGQLDMIGAEVLSELQSVEQIYQEK